MTKHYIFIAFAMLAALSMVSCNNKPQEPTQEEVQEMKQALADSVLAEIDALADKYIVASENSFDFFGFELTEKEKQVKPDYLLDPSKANNFITKSQKINALACYIIDIGVRKIYGMPVEESKEAIAKLALELNYPINENKLDKKIPLSEIITTEYEKFKENGDVACFWQFQYAVIAETSYIIAQNPELFYSKISEEQWQYYCQKFRATKKALETLAQYDEEMASLLEFKHKNCPYSSDEERSKENISIEASKQYHINHKDKYIARRNAMLQ